jgi:hypothetical protein
MKRSLTVALCLLGAFLPACGTTSTPADTTTTPTATTQSTLTFTSTVTGSPVVGANVVVAGSSYTTGADGVITLSAPAAIGSTIDATAPGFLDRATVVTSTAALTLWEIPAGADVTFVRQLAYNRTGTPEVLWRPTAVNIFLQLTGDLANDPVARAAHVQAAAMATAMTGARVTVQVGTPATAGLIFTLQINASSSTSTTFLTQTGGVIQGGRVEYPSLTTARNPAAVAHEIGHMLGFGHAPSGLMCPSACGAANFSPLDQAVFVSMWQRLPGTAALDNDRRLLASSASSTTVFNCDIR